MTKLDDAKRHFETALGGRARDVSAKASDLIAAIEATDDTQATFADVRAWLEEIGGPGFIRDMIARRQAASNPRHIEHNARLKAARAQR